MKLKKVESIIKKSKSVAIVGNGGAVWIGNEQAMYPTYFEQMNFDTLMTVFDLDDEKRESITEVPSELIARADTADSCIGERLLKRHPIRIVWTGQPLVGLFEENGAQEILFVNEKYLLPLADAKDGVELYLRRDSAGKAYVAVKSGMLLIGLVEPEPIIDETFMQHFKRLYELSEFTLQNQPAAPDLQEHING